MKSEKDWSKEKDEKALGNSRALNSIYNEVNKNIFRIINTCTSAKEAWELSKLLIKLGEKILEENMAKKFLISIPKMYDMKVMAIEEARDVSIMKVDELIRSLLTFEMVINDKSEKKSKSVAFVRPQFCP